MAREPAARLHLVRRTARRLTDPAPRPAQIGLRETVVVGGLDMMRQAKELARRPHVVIATPGRLCDHVKSSAGIADALRRVLGRRRGRDQARGVRGRARGVEPHSHFPEVKCLPLLRNH